MTPVLVLGLLTVAAVVGSPPHSPYPHYSPPALCTEYGGCHHYHPSFVPAPPGKTPPCAKHGETFCEKIDQYPTHLIRYLVENWVYDHKTLLSDESRNDPPFKKQKTIKPTYGPPPQPHRAYPHGGYPQPHYHPAAANTINYTQEGYPDRRYPVPSYRFSGPSLAYSAIMLPDVTPYDPAAWWKRYTRSNKGEGEQSRAKRQLPGQDVQLCPTRSQFVSPGAAVNSQGNWMYVVNLDKDQNRMTQQVRAEVCVSNQCQGICTLPNGYTSRCEQQFVQKRLIALQESGNQLYTDTFWLPHCCICQITPSNNG